MVSIKALQSFGVEVSALQVFFITEPGFLLTAIKDGNLQEPYIILGGGTNVLFTSDYIGTIYINSIKGFSFSETDNGDVLVSAMSGERWHDLVMFCVEHNWGGVENLSLIPGTVGAAPIQNIGAYGVELKDVLDHLLAIDLTTGEERIFTNAECQFGYRNSIFKQALKGKYFILSVTLRLNKHPELHTTYGAIQQVLTEKGISEPTIGDVSDAVIAIRSSKLPDPKVLGNAGSFFKNPEVSKAQFAELKALHSEMPGYPVPHDQVKIPAGWMIEKCGFKGKRIGNCGAHKDQALVLVNYGGATGEELYNCAMLIRNTVHETFGIWIEPEVNVI
ncbi:MAG: UDP-N-acetylmuramate dehydrogenase [Chitinophagales bacterium]